MRQTVAIILGRGGSKGVPGKNTAMIAGRACVLWSIDHARRARGVAHVCVSSDDQGMLSLARDAGAIPLRRPPDLASDTARVDDAARHAALQAAQTLNLPVRAGMIGDQPPNIVILYANVPVRPEGLIDAALDVLGRTRCDSVQSYQPVGKHHPWWTARLADDARVRPWEGEVLNHGIYRRQDLPPAYIPDGGVIALTWEALFCEIPGAQPGPHQFFGVDRRGVINPEGSVIDIDSREDLLVADAILSRNARGG